MELTANSIIFITYVTYYEKDSDSRKTYPTVLNCHNCYGTGTTLHANTQEMTTDQV